jgi:hypothetical protein
MKWFLALVLVGAVAFAVAFVPPRTAARLTARGLRASWDWLSSLGAEATREGPTPARQVARKAQAASPQRRASRDGIVPQPPKETLNHSDRAALGALVAQPQR